MCDAGHGSGGGDGTIRGHERVNASLVVIQTIEPDYKHWDEEYAI